MLLLTESAGNLGIKPDLVTINTALASLGSRGLWQDSLAALAALGSNSDMISFNTVLGTLAQQWKWALQIFGEVKERRLGDAVTYTTACAASAKSHWAMGAGLLQDAKAGGGRGDRGWGNRHLKFETRYAKSPHGRTKTAIVMGHVARSQTPPSMSPHSMPSCTYTSNGGPGCNRHAFWPSYL